VKELVLDASVIVKWVVPERSEEPDGVRALELLGAMGAGRLSVVEPPHWLAEVAAVVTRLAPERAPGVVDCCTRWSFRSSMGRRSTGTRSGWRPGPGSASSTLCITPSRSSGRTGS
jgi:predicted nucleic acid-binding protein